MVAEIIAVGTELLLGNIVNTNAKFLSEQLAFLGVDVHFQSVVGDNPVRLKSVVELAKSRSDIILMSGGLGPTQDDLTKQTVCEVFNDTLIFDEEENEKIENFFKALNRTMTENNRRQALVPKNGEKIPNENGTAPGMIFKDDGKYAFLMPGPPNELYPMFNNKVRPFIEKLSDSVLYSTMLNVVGVGESKLETMAEDLLASQNPTCALYAKTAEVSIRITAKAKTSEIAKEMCEEKVGQFYEILGDNIYGRDASSLEQAVVKLLAEKGKTVATAESCTGGLLGKMITSIENSSAVFGYGAIVYANEAKQKILGVKERTLKEHGAVSQQTAAEMAMGIKELSGSYYGVSITGIAGPGGGTEEKPVGTVYIGIAFEDEIYVQKSVIKDRTREYVRAASVSRALDMIRRATLNIPLKYCDKIK